jgi:hypothetical protein
MTIRLVVIAVFADFSGGKFEKLEVFCVIGLIGYLVNWLNN